MHYRITRVRHEAGKRQAMVDMLNAKSDLIESFQGLRYVRMIAVSETETVAISEYETEADLNAVQPRFREVMVDMVPLMTGPPDVSNGDAFWEMVLSKD